ncbi:hypothetical protein K1719_011394 [Acacia pycnantha]|nr:hypothetical protein K1719_011394 [Acacia pycnantha]
MTGRHWIVPGHGQVLLNLVVGVLPHDSPHNNEPRIPRYEDFGRRKVRTVAIKKVNFSLVRIVVASRLFVLFISTTSINELGWKSHRPVVLSLTWESHCASVIIASHRLLSLSSLIVVFWVIVAGYRLHQFLDRLLSSEPRCPSLYAHALVVEIRALMPFSLCPCRVAIMRAYNPPANQFRIREKTHEIEGKDVTDLLGVPHSGKEVKVDVSDTDPLYERLRKEYGKMKYDDILKVITSGEAGDKFELLFMLHLLGESFNGRLQNLEQFVTGSSV